VVKKRFFRLAGALGAALFAGILSLGVGYGVFWGIARITAIGNKPAEAPNYDEIPHWRELHNKITPNLVYDIEFVDDIVINGNSEYVGQVLYMKRPLIQIENDLGKKFNEEFALHYDIKTFVMYENMRVLAHEMVHIADFYDKSYSYSERQTEYRAYMHFLEMAGEDATSIYLKAANYMVILNDTRAAGNEYKW
jgi:hypothetical protein